MKNSTSAVDAAVDQQMRTLFIHFGIVPGLAVGRFRCESVTCGKVLTGIKRINLLASYQSCD